MAKPSAAELHPIFQPEVLEQLYARRLQKMESAIAQEHLEILNGLLDQQDQQDGEDLRCDHCDALDRMTRLLQEVREEQKVQRATMERLMRIVAGDA